jgi:3-hydroxyacyl-CoA dehydrogenase / enoyl-CoA hydratase / 3-hydroxybutyryl-CoA epimerase
MARRHRRNGARVIDNSDDGDAASVLGLDFPARMGGILRWAEDHGLALFVEVCDRLAREQGKRLAASPWLRALAARGKGLARWRRGTIQGSET